MELSQYGKSLYDLIPNKEHVLIRYIYAIDENLDDDSILRSIAERMGIYVPEGQDANTYLYFAIKDILANEKDAKETEKLINMTFEEFKNFIRQNGIFKKNYNISQKIDVSDQLSDEIYSIFANRLMIL